MESYRLVSAGRALGLGSLIVWASAGSAFAQQSGAVSGASPQVEESQAPAAMATKRARESYREGVDAFNRSDFETARIAFLQTLALKPDVPEVRRNLGLAQIYSGHYLEGARRVARVLHSPNAGSPQNRTRMLESLKKAEAHLERLTIEVDVDGALVEIDGEQLGLSPISYVWYVAPGHYDLRVSKSGYVAHRERRVSKAAVASHLRISLAIQTEPDPESVPSTVEPSAALGNPPLDVRPAARPNSAVLIVGGVASAAALLGGAYSLYEGTRLTDKLESNDGKSETSACRGIDSPACNKLATMFADQKQFGVLSPSLFIFAGVAAVGTLGYWFWPRTAQAQHEPEGVSLREVGFHLGRGESGLQLSGTF